MTVETITVEQLKARLQQGEKIKMIDVREDFEVQNGMIDGAQHIPLAEIPNHHEQFSHGEEVIFICQGGYRSEQACLYLQHLGYTGMKNLIEGMQAW